MHTKLVEVKAGARAAVIDATETLQYQITQQAKQEQDLASLGRGGSRSSPAIPTRPSGISSRRTPRNWRTPSGTRKISSSGSPRLKLRWTI